jgi:hypothetical protein
LPALLLVIATSPLAAAAVDAPGAEAVWAAGVARFLEAQFTAQPVGAVYAGRHEFDGQAPDLSAPALEREVARRPYRNPAASLRDCHDQFLSFGGPLPLVRQLMLGNASPPL